MIYGNEINGLRYKGMNNKYRGIMGNEWMWWIVNDGGWNWLNGIVGNVSATRLCSKLLWG